MTLLSSPGGVATPCRGPATEGECQMDEPAALDAAILPEGIRSRFVDGVNGLKVHKGDAAAFVRAAERLEAGPRTALLIDDGCYHAELRGISVRGHLAAPEKPPSGLEGFLEVVPERTSAWHYGAMRKRDDA